MKPDTTLLRLAALLLAAGCAVDRPTGPGAGPLDQGSTALSQAGGAAHLSVMTRNLYVGADVDLVIRALATPDPTDDLPALLHAVSVVQETDFPTRAAAIAGEIAKTRPDIIGLQEVSRLDVDLHPVGIPIAVHQDFEQILLSALASRGLSYVVAGRIQNTSAQPLPFISLVDYDVMLIDPSRVQLGPIVTARNFRNNIGTVAPRVTIIRGYVIADVTVEGKSYRVATTHLESGSAPGLDLLRAAQAAELADSVGPAPAAVVLGDLNDEVGSPMYRVLAAAGYSDAWPALRPENEGLSCCNDENLANRLPGFDQRIDYVLSRGLGRPGDPVMGSITLVGARSSDRVPGPVHPLWPSDHAGVVAKLLTLPGPALATAR